MIQGEKFLYNILIQYFFQVKGVEIDGKVIKFLFLLLKIEVFNLILYVIIYFEVMYLLDLFDVMLNLLFVV